MEDITNFLSRVIVSHLACGPTVRPQIARLHYLAQTRQISWSACIDSASKLVTDKSLYGQMMEYYRLQAIGWGLTILSAILA